MANNNGIFNAAIQGGTSVIASRWQYSTASASYAIQAARIVAFATQVDADIPADPTLGQADFDLMEAICSAWWDNRSTKVAIAGNYEPAASAIVAIWTQMKGNMLPPGAVPVPLDPGEVPKVLFDDEPGVIGYTDVLYRKTGSGFGGAPYMHFGGDTAASFGNVPAESGAIRLSTGANLGVVTARKNNDADDYEVLQTLGSDDTDTIVMGEIDPARNTVTAIDLTGQFWDEGPFPFYFRFASSESAENDEVLEGSLIQVIPTAPGGNRGALNMETLSNTESGGYGITMLVGPNTSNVNNSQGGPIFLLSGVLTSDVAPGENAFGGPIHLLAGGIGAGTDGSYTGGEITLRAGDVGRSGVASHFGGGITIEAGTFDGPELGTSVGGPIQIVTGSAGGLAATIGDGGAMSLRTGGGGTSVSGDGGDFEILAGDGFDNGGAITITSGTSPAGNAGGFGGAINIIGGNSGGECSAMNILHGIGIGGGLAGEILIGNVNVSDVIRIDSSANGALTGIGVFSTLPSTQLTSYPVFTDAGTPSGTNVLVDVGAVPTQANINNNFATCGVAFNDILDILETFGWTAP